MDNIKTLVRDNKYIEVIKILQNTYLSGYLLYEISNVTLKKKTPQLIAFLNFVKQKINKNTYMLSIPSMYFNDLFFIKNTFDLSLMEISLKVFQTGISVDKISFELLKLMKENHSYYIFKAVFNSVTNYFSSIYYRIKTLHKIVDYMEHNFTFEEIKQIFSEINLCNWVAKKNHLGFLRRIDKYLTSFHYINNDLSSFTPILDAARYSSFNMFKFIYDKISDEEKLYSNDFNENILTFSACNSDTRILKFILETGFFKISGDKQIFFNNLLSHSNGGLKKYIEKLKIIENHSNQVTENSVYMLLLDPNYFLKVVNCFKDIKFTPQRYIPINSELFKNNTCKKILIERCQDFEFLIYESLKCLNFDDPFYDNFDLDKLYQKDLYLNKLLQSSHKKSEEYQDRLFYHILEYVKRNKLKNICLGDLTYYKYNFIEKFYRFGLFNMLPFSIKFVNSADFFCFFHLRTKEKQKLLAWNKTILFLKKTFRTNNCIKKKMHCIKFNNVLSEIKPRTRIKIPKQICEKDIVKLITRSDITITPKADGIKSTIENFEMYPTISASNYDSKFDCEIVEIDNVKVHFIISSYQNIVYLCSKHPYFPLECLVNFETLMIQPYCLFDKERKALNRFIENNSNQNGLWWPKIIYKIQSINPFFKKLTCPIFFSVYPTDGWIVNSESNLYKLKPTKHLTVDLLYRHGSFYSREFNKFNENVKFDNNELKEDHIYRLHYSKGLWQVDTERIEKQKANPQNVIDLVVDQVYNPIDIGKILKYFSICEPYYQVTEKSHKKKHIDNVIEIYSKKGNVVDIGCGFKININKRKMTAKSYVGIDIDPKINNESVVLLNLKYNWEEQLDLLKNNKIKWGTYDNIVMTNSIQYIYDNEEKNIEYINKLAADKCVMIIKFLDWSLLESMGKHLIKSSNDYVRIIAPKTIKYYYSSLHREPCQEHVYSIEDIKLLFPKWKVLFLEKKTIYEFYNPWDNYLNCFRYICLQL